MPIDYIHNTIVIGGDVADEITITEQAVLDLDWHAPDIPSSQVNRMVWLDEDKGRDFLREAHGARAKKQPLLLVQFHTAATAPPSVYVYFGVPYSSYEDLKTGGDFGSTGKALNASIKGAFEYARIDIEPNAPDKPEVNDA